MFPSIGQSAALYTCLEFKPFNYKNTKTVQMTLGRGSSEFWGHFPNHVSGVLNMFLGSTWCCRPAFETSAARLFENPGSYSELY